MDCYNYRVEFDEFYQKYGTQLNDEFVIGKVDLFRNIALKRRYSSLVKNEFPVIVSFKPHQISEPIM